VSRRLSLSSCGAAPPAFYTLPLHDALPIFTYVERGIERGSFAPYRSFIRRAQMRRAARILATSSKKSLCTSQKNERRGAKSSTRSEEHTSELQSRENVVCRLPLATAHRAAV